MINNLGLKKNAFDLGIYSVRQYVARLGFHMEKTSLKKDKKRLTGCIEGIVVHKEHLIKLGSMISRPARIDLRALRAENASLYNSVKYYATIRNNIDVSEYIDRIIRWLEQK